MRTEKISGFINQTFSSPSLVFCLPSSSLIMDYDSAISRLQAEIKQTDSSQNSFSNWILILKFGRLPLLPFQPWLILVWTAALVTIVFLLTLTNKVGWKWRTTFAALLFSSISVLVIIQKLSFSLEDVMLLVSVSAQCLVLLSLGVYLAECVDIIITGKHSNLIVHHILLIICVGGTFLTEQTVGFFLAPVWLKFCIKRNLLAEFLREINP